jgi:hypothetical protein
MPRGEAPARTMRRTVLSLALMATVLGVGPAIAEAQASQTPEAQPARPSLTNPAELTPVGYPQLETGILYARASPESPSRLSWTQTLKMSVTEWAQGILAGEPLVGSHGEVTRAGDGAGGVQICPVCSNAEGPHVAVAYLRRFYESSASNLDVGGFLQSGTLLVSLDAFGLDIDANGVWNEQEEHGSRRTQSGQSIAVSRGVGDFQITTELWRFQQPFRHAHAAGALAGASYSVRPNFVVDFAVTRGLTRTSTRWQVTAGFTYLVPRALWRTAQPQNDARR